MIHKISVENFFSIRDEVSLDFSVAKNSPDLANFRTAPSDPSIRLPTVIAFFGPNASGKSTLLRAITSTVSFALKSFELNPGDLIPGFQSFMSNTTFSEPTRICIEFDALWLASSETDTAEKFRYELVLTGGLDGGFAARTKVDKEALYYFPHGRPKRLFERKSVGEPYFSSEFDIRKGDARVEAIKENSSVISTLAKFNNAFAVRIWNDLKGLQSNLWGLNRAQYPNSDIIRFYLDNSQVLSSLNNEIKRLDIGIEEMLVDADKNGIMSFFSHRLLSAPIMFEEESSGTQNFVKMFPVLNYVLGMGQIAVIDEFDADLHPDLVMELFNWFHSIEKNALGAQMFVTVHNSSVLDSLEKEEVFFVEKDRLGRTDIYGASSIQGLRRGVSLFNKYMGGELGAKPNIG